MILEGIYWGWIVVGITLAVATLIGYILDWRRRSRSLNKTNGGEK